MGGERELEKVKWKPWPHLSCPRPPCLCLAPVTLYSEKTFRLQGLWLDKNKGDRVFYLWISLDWFYLELIGQLAVVKWLTLFHFYTWQWWNSSTSDGFWALQFISDCTWFPPEPKWDNTWDSGDRAHWSLSFSYQGALGVYPLSHFKMGSLVVALWWSYDMWCVTSVPIITSSFKHWACCHDGDCGLVSSSSSACSIALLFFLVLMIKYLSSASCHPLYYWYHFNDCAGLHLSSFKSFQCAQLLRRDGNERNCG